LKPDIFMPEALLLLNCNQPPTTRTKKCARKNAQNNKD
jgi:hypothetical protein